MEVHSQKDLHELGRKKRVAPSIMTDVTPVPKRANDGINRKRWSSFSRCEGHAYVPFLCRIVA